MRPFVCLAPPLSLHVQLTTMADPGVIALAAELTGQTRLSDADWNKVEATAQALANALRVKNSARLLFKCRLPLRVKVMPRR